MGFVWIDGYTFWETKIFPSGSWRRKQFCFSWIKDLPLWAIERNHVSRVFGAFFAVADLKQFVVEALDLCHVVFCQVLEDRRHAHVFLDRRFVQPHPQLAAHPLHFVAAKEKPIILNFLHTCILFFHPHTDQSDVCADLGIIYGFICKFNWEIYWEVSGLLLLLMLQHVSLLPPILIHMFDKHILNTRHGASI